MKPGVTVLPPRSTVFVARPARAATSAFEPTARMRSPAIAIASARGWRASRVRMRPFFRIRSGCSCVSAASARLLDERQARERGGAAEQFSTRNGHSGPPCGNNTGMSGVLYRYAAFTTTPNGGNPAGIWIGDRLPPDPRDAAASRRKSPTRKRSSSSPRAASSGACATSARRRKSTSAATRRSRPACCSASSRARASTGSHQGRHRPGLGDAHATGAGRRR